MQLMDPDADFFSQNVVVPYPVKSEEVGLIRR
jgi:hypothetical protein